MLEKLPDFERTPFTSLPTEVRETIVLYLQLVGPDLPLPNVDFACEDNYVTYWFKCKNAHDQAYVVIE